MNPDFDPAPGAQADSRTYHAGNSNEDGADFTEVLARLHRGLPAIIGLAALGAAAAVIIYLLACPLFPTTTSMRVSFSFPGVGRGEYPDHSKFQPDDLRSPEVIIEALKLQGLEPTEDTQFRIRAALTIETLIPPNVIKERDRLRAAGQTLAPYFPDEYLLSLVLPRSFKFNAAQRERMLTGIIRAYQSRFQRTYSDVPLAFGNAFESLKSADYYEYEIILNGEIQDVIAYLDQQLEQAKLFRSPSTNLTFGDLVAQTKLFSRIHLYETLGFIRKNGLSRDRETALVKIDYFLQSLQDQEQKAIEEAKVVDDLLTKTQERSQNYVLGIKTQATQQRNEATTVDQNLIDSLLANDSYNFLVRQALTAGLKVKDIQAEKAQLMERRKDMERFLNSDTRDQSVMFKRVQQSLGELQDSYNQLILNIRKTHSDFAKQQYADAIRITMPPITSNLYRSLSLAGTIGGLIGLLLGAAFSLLGIHSSPRRST